MCATTLVCLVLHSLWRSNSGHHTDSKHFIERAIFLSHLLNYRASNGCQTLQNLRPKILEESSYHLRLYNLVKKDLKVQEQRAMGYLKHHGRSVWRVITCGNFAEKMCEKRKVMLIEGDSMYNEPEI